MSSVLKNTIHKKCNFIEVDGNSEEWKKIKD